MLGDPANGEAGRGMGLYWRIEKQVRELEASAGSVVGATGALYAVRRELVVEVPAGHDSGRCIHSDECGEAGISGGVR